MKAVERLPKLIPEWREGFWFLTRRRSKAISLVDLVETDNEAKKQKHPGLRLKQRTGHCVVARSLQVHEDMRVTRAWHCPVLCFTIPGN